MDYLRKPSVFLVVVCDENTGLQGLQWRDNLWLLDVHDCRNLSKKRKNVI